MILLEVSIHGVEPLHVLAHLGNDGRDVSAVNPLRAPGDRREKIGLNGYADLLRSLHGCYHGSNHDARLQRRVAVITGSCEGVIGLIDLSGATLWEKMLLSGGTAAAVLANGRSSLRLHFTRTRRCG